MTIPRCLRLLVFIQIALFCPWQNITAEEPPTPDPMFEESPYDLWVRISPPIVVDDENRDEFLVQPQKDFAAQKIYDNTQLLEALQTRGRWTGGGVRTPPVQHVQISGYDHKGSPRQTFSGNGTIFTVHQTKYGTAGLRSNYRAGHTLSEDSRVPFLGRLMDVDILRDRYDPDKNRLQAAEEGYAPCLFKPVENKCDQQYSILTLGGSHGVMGGGALGEDASSGVSFHPILLKLSSDDKVGMSASYPRVSLLRAGITERSDGNGHEAKLWVQVDPNTRLQKELPKDHEGYRGDRQLIETTVQEGDVLKVPNHPLRFYVKEIAPADLDHDPPILGWIQFIPMVKGEQPPKKKTVE